MSTESKGERPPAEPEGTSWLDVLIATKIPLLAGLLAVCGLAFVWFVGIPSREITIAVMLTCTAGPYVVCVLWIFAMKMDEGNRMPVEIVDEDHETQQLWTFRSLANTTIEGGELATRRTKAGTLYIAKEYIQNPSEDAKDVLKGHWEATMAPLDWKEERNALKAFYEEVVPRVESAVNARASSDAKVVANTDRVAARLVLGAEQDSVFAGLSDDPMNWDTEQDTSPDLDDQESEQPEDVDDEREEKPDVGSREMQKEARHAATDGGEDA